MKNSRIYQPTFITLKEDGMEIYVFQDILSMDCVIHFPSYIGFDSIESWTHEFTELSLFCLIIYETQFMDDNDVILEMEDGKHSLSTTLPHFLTSLTCKSERIIDGKSETHTPNDYLKGFKTKLE